MAIYSAYSLIVQMKSESAKVQLPNGAWVPARPFNYRHDSWVDRIAAALSVLTGKADAITWPGQ